MMDIKEMIKINLDNPHYVIDDIEITSSVLEQMSKIVKYIMTNENLSFEEAFIKFHQSDLFTDLVDIENRVWATDALELINIYYSYGKTK